MNNSVDLMQFVQNHCDMNGIYNIPVFLILFWFFFRFIIIFNFYYTCKPTQNNIFILDDPPEITVTFSYISCNES